MLYDNSLVREAERVQGGAQDPAGRRHRPRGNLTDLYTFINRVADPDPIFVLFFFLVILFDQSYKTV